MSSRFLITALAFVTTVFAESAGPSRLQFTTPERWTCIVDPDTKIPSLNPPGAHAVVTFAGSTEAKGSAEMWLDVVWTEMLKQMRPAGEPSVGREGDFVTRTSEFIKPDSSKPWMRVYAFVKDGRGESVIYIAANKAEFQSQLPTVTQMVRGMKLAPPGMEERPNSTPSAAPQASDTIPVLAWNEPAGYYRGANRSPIEYSSNQVNAGVQIYQFRPYTGDIEAAFRRTLLRDWIAPQFAEGQLAGAPQITPTRIQGATKALSARFHENIGGTMNERMRMLIVVGNQAAIVDVSANSTYSWQKSGPVMMPMLESMRVDREAAAPLVAASAGPVAADFAGLYMGFTSKYNSVYKQSLRALHYYLFSPDGRVHSCYDFPPGGSDTSWKRFNFDEALRTDPVNTGRYTVRGNQVILQTGGEQSTGSIQDANTVRISGVTYERQP